MVSILSCLLFAMVQIDNPWQSSSVRLKWRVLESSIKLHHWWVRLRKSYRYKWAWIISHINYEPNWSTSRDCTILNELADWWSRHKWLAGTGLMESSFWWRLASYVLWIGHLNRWYPVDVFGRRWVRKLPRTRIFIHHRCRCRLDIQIQGKSSK